MDSDLQQIVTLAEQVDARLTSLQQQVNVDALEETTEDNTKVFDGLELTPWLLAQGALADSDTASGNVPTATQRQPSIECASFAIDPQTKSFANAYWYKKLGADEGKTTFTYEASFLFPTTADVAASQAVEFDFQQVISGIVYNLGWQFDYADGKFRVWNRGVKAWVPVMIALERPSTLTWTRLALAGHRDANSIYYATVTINGTTFSINQSFPAPNLGLTDMLNCAFQLDGNKAGVAYRVMVDGMRLTIS